MHFRDVFQCIPITTPVKVPLQVECYSRIYIILYYSSIHMHTELESINIA